MKKVPEDQKAPRIPGDQRAKDESGQMHWIVPQMCLDLGDTQFATYL